MDAEPGRHSRGPKVRAAVLDATIAELADTGFGALTVEGVARRAGVHKTTVYRRWPDREALVVDALTEHIAADIPIPDTGSLDTDLTLLARGLVRWLTGPSGRAVIGTMLADTAHEPRLADMRRRIFRDRLRRAEPVITRAIDRGTLPAGTNAAEVIRTLVAPIYLRLLVTGEPLSTAVADRAARVALAAARSGILTTD